MRASPRGAGARGLHCICAFVAHAFRKRAKGEKSQVGKVSADGTEATAAGTGDPGSGWSCRQLWATCRVGLACTSLPASLSWSAPHCGSYRQTTEFPPVFEVQVQPPGVCGVCPHPTPTLPASPPPPGCGPGAQGSRKEAEQAGPVSLPGQGRARTTAEKAVGAQGLSKRAAGRRCHLDRNLVGLPLPR